MSPRALLWTGRIMSGLVILFMLMDGAIKLVPIQPVIDSLRELGYPATESFARFLGVLTLLCTALYAWPRTALSGRPGTRSAVARLAATITASAVARTAPWASSSRLTRSSSLTMDRP